MAAYEVLLLNTAIPQIQAAQSGDTYVVPRAIAFNAGVNVVNNDITVYGVTVGRGAGAVATNTAVGASALAANTSGAQNTTVGNQAGATTNAAYLTAVGYQAARYNTGDGNTAIGTNALLVSGGVNGTGTNNVAVGKDALYTNTTASRNTAVGYQAGYSVIESQYNAYLGYGAGYGNTGDSNVGVGDSALSASGSAVASVAIGQGALSATTGNYNTAVGYNSGAAITTGSKNTIIGRYSGNQGGLDIRAASNYIVLSDGDGNPRWIGDSTGAMGYGPTTGGTVTQATSRTTGVTLNKPTGQITLVSAAGSNTFQSFTVTNNTVTANDVVVVSQKSGTDLNQIFVTNVAAGSFQITFATTGGTTTEQPVFTFAVIKGQTT